MKISKLNWMTFGQLIRLPPIFITLFWTMMIVAASWWYLPILTQYELLSINWRFHWRGEIAPHPAVIIIGIDTASMLTNEYDEDYFEANPDMALLKKWPFPRRLHAKLIERLANAGAKMIVFDLLFSSPSDSPKDDQILAKAIETYADKIVLGTNFTNDRSYDAQLPLPYDLFLPANIEDDKMVGFVNYGQDDDGNIRRGLVCTSSAFGKYYSIDGLAIHKSQPKVELPQSDEHRMINFAGPAGTFPAVDYYTLFDPKYQDKTKPFHTGAKVKGWKVFQDKIVLVGPKGNFQHDDHRTPFGDGNYIDKEGRKRLMPGVEIHANAIATFLSKVHIHELPHAWSIIFILFLGVLFSVILFLIDSPSIKLIPMFVFGGVYLGICQIAFVKWNFIFPLAGPELLLIGSTLSTITFQGIIEQIEKRRVSGMLRKYVSKNVADELIGSGQDVGSLLAPKKRTVTLLYSDVRDFTTMTENSEPEPFFQQLNEYLGAMVECVFKNQGTLDKFIGDAVMAVFGNPNSCGKKEDAWNAVKTACEMRQRLAELNQRWEKEDKPIFRIGIGLNHGDVLAGDIGSNEKKEYGVIGDPVNTSARVESLTKEMKADILITDSVYELVKDQVEVDDLGDIQVKGRAKTVNVYALKDLKEGGKK